jgi:hypothetical protein
LAGIKGVSGRKTIDYELKAKASIQKAMPPRVLVSMFRAVAAKVIATGDMRYLGGNLDKVLPSLGRGFGGEASSVIYINELRAVIGLSASPNAPASISDGDNASTDNASRKELVSAADNGARSSESKLMLTDGVNSSIQPSIGASVSDTNVSAGEANQSETTPSQEQ